jgi:zinc protease
MRMMRLRIADCGLRISSCLVLLGAFTFSGLGQIPEPGPAKSVQVPAVKETKLKNGLTVAVVEKHSSPIVTVQLVIRSGAGVEETEQAGLANFTADMLTKGTKTRTAEQIAEEMEFLGASINSGAGWNSSSVSTTVTSDKLDQAMAIMADVVLNPSFKQEELDLMRSQSLDELKSSLTQPSFLASYVTSAYSFNEHPAGGTPQSLAAINRNSLLDFYKNNYEPDGAVLIFTGDILPSKANAIANTFFGGWKGKGARKEITATMTEEAPPLPPGMVKASSAAPLFKRIVVIDVPQAGQASVTYAVPVREGRIEFGPAGTTANSVNKVYYPALALNSVLGGGYSSRLNQEIRIKRGLSYGAGSGFAWRLDAANFTTRTQTKNVSAAEVVELVLAEIRKLADTDISNTELVPRKSVLTGTFGRNLETTNGLASALADLYVFEIGTSELNKYVSNVNSVSDSQIREFAKSNLVGGDIIIVGDYSIFKDDLAKRFPEINLEVIKASELDITKPNLRK